MPGLLVEPVDEIDMQADWSDRSHGRSILSWEAYQRAGVVNHQMFPVRTQRNGAFQGAYNLQETFDGTWREREGYDDHQYFEAETSAFAASRPVNVRFTKKAPDETDYSPLAAFLNGVNLTGNARRDYLLANADIPKMINYAAVTAIVRARRLVVEELRPCPEPHDRSLDHPPVGPRPHAGQRLLQVDSTFVTPAEPGDNTSALMVALLAVPQWRDMYFRRLRTLVNDILAPGRMEAVYDASHRSLPAGRGPRLRGLAVPQLAELRDLPSTAVQRHPGAP